MPQKESPFRTLARVSKGQPGYKGAIRVENRWKAQIDRCGVRTYLGTYDDELTAAIVYQAADEEYKKLNLTPYSGVRRKRAPAPITNPPNNTLQDRLHK